MSATPSRLPRVVAACALYAFCTAAPANTVSETLIFLQADGQAHLTQRAIRSDAPEHRFHVDKSLTLDQLGYIDPNDFTWNDDGAQTNVLTFKQGDFTVMYPGSFDAPELTREADGTFVYNSWDGQTREDGHFGMWHEPGNFTRFNYAWILPAHFELIDYVSNRDGQWVERNNTLTFFATDVNDLTFSIRYRERDLDGDGVVDRLDRCPNSVPDTAVNAQGCERDTDGDGVMDFDDRCPRTAAGLAVDSTGCEPDRDGDGVADVRDLCGRTPTGAIVDADGCGLDSDGDGISDAVDNCPGTPQGALVDRRGCEIDCDEDGVVNSADQCPRTAAGQAVDDKGCELDSDGDGVVDTLDQCADTPQGRAVDSNGCELDSDG
ncbi:MAG: thrombospondin type 3 repeat-containing protein, partial [Gammaproteobacteria bacterium]|nr:thrombospondin type 3 repeat-containing protein [Gammaproteobacteria bacterium]